RHPAQGPRTRGGDAGTGAGPHRGKGREEGGAEDFRREEGGTESDRGEKARPQGRGHAKGGRKGRQGGLTAPVRRDHIQLQASVTGLPPARGGRVAANRHEGPPPKARLIFSRRRLIGAAAAAVFVPGAARAQMAAR